MNYNRFLTPFVILLFILCCLIIWMMRVVYPLPAFHQIAIFTLILFALTRFKIKIPRVTLEISITWPVAFFGIWLSGPWMGTSLMLAVGFHIIIYFIVPQIREDWKLLREYFKDYLLSTLYNISYCCLITCVPGIIFTGLGGSGSFRALNLPILAALCCSAVTCYIISLITTNTRIALFENKTPWKLHIDPLSELMELSLGSLSIVAIIIYNTLAPPYLFLLIIPTLMAFYFLNFGIKAATEKDDLSLLFEFASLITSTINLDTTLRNIAEGIMKSLNADGCSISLKNRSTGEFETLAVAGHIARMSLSNAENNSIAGHLSAFKRSVSDFKESDWLKERFFADLRGEVSIALITEKQHITGFVLLSKNQFERDHRSLLTILASQAGIAISNASLYLQALETNRQLKTTQTQLVQSSKMTSVGQLASGVALRLDTPLKNILKNFNHIAKNAKNGEKLERRLNISRQAIIRCIDIHEKLFHYTRQEETKEVDIEVWDLIDDTVEFLTSLLEKENIEILKRRSEVRPLKGDPNYLSQVLTNLILNSRDALQASAGLPRQIMIKSCEREGSLFIEVEDNGIGMEEEVRERIFEPFYSTKEIGKGTGLGLSVSLEIIRRNGGKIHVDSEPGKGSTFTVELPYR